MRWWEAAIWGSVGGGISELVSVTKFRLVELKKWPKALRESPYWILGICWVLVGGALAALYHRGTPLTEIICVNIGATAPLIVHTLMKATPAGQPGTVDAGAPAGSPADVTANTGPYL
jgi:hypothetical protein